MEYPKKIMKRNGSLVVFDREKIENAIRKANEAVRVEAISPKQLDNLVDAVIEDIPAVETPSVEQIQDIVEEKLIAFGFAKTAKAYILYRNEHAKLRSSEHDLMKIYSGLTYMDAAESDLKRENANVDANTAMGTMLKYGSEGAKHFVDNYVLPKDIAAAHINGDIHIHDKDFYMLTETCCQIDLIKLFEGGFSTGHGYIREPKSIRSYSSLACIAIQANQNEMHGGQAIPNFDYAMARGVAHTFRKEYFEAFSRFLMARLDLSADQADKLADELKETVSPDVVMDGAERKEKLAALEQKIQAWAASVPELEAAKGDVSRIHARAMEVATKETEKATYQAMESLIHNFNTMNSRAGAQVPFSSINYGTDTTPEGRMVMKCLLHATNAGLGNGETPIFPVQIFKVKEGINYNPGDPNYDLFKLAIKVSAKRLFPNFSFLDAPFNLQYYKKGDYRTEVGYMGCAHPDETVTVKYGNADGNAKTISIGTLYYELAERNRVKNYGKSFYVEPEDLLVYDTFSDGFVKVKKAIENPAPDKLYQLRFEDGHALLLTGDHPLPIKGRGRVHVRDIAVGDEIPLSNLVKGSGYVTLVSIELVDNASLVYDLETESDHFDLSGINSHNCRTRVMGNHYDPTQEVTPGRGNLSFTSVNLPRIGIMANGDIGAFYKRLDNVLDLCCRQLLHRFKIQCEKTVQNYPFLMGQGIWIGSEKLGIHDRVAEVLKHGTLSVGFIGLAETLVALTGKHHGESEDSQELGLEIISHMRAFMDKKSEETGLNFTLLATPAEGLSGRFVKIDKKRFGEIPGITDRDYYTNSFHVPVYYPISAFKKIKLEAPYHALTNAGHISYVELDGDTAKNPEAFEAIIRCMKESGIGYGSVNHPVDRDPVCGYTGVIDDVCPRCGRHAGEPVSVEKLNELRKKYPDVPVYDANH